MKRENAVKYQIPEQEVGIVSEPAAINYIINRRSDISRAITGEELLNRLRPRIESLFK